MRASGASRSTRARRVISPMKELPRASVVISLSWPRSRRKDLTISSRSVARPASVVLKWSTDGSYLSSMGAMTPGEDDAVVSEAPWPDLERL